MTLVRFDPLDSLFFRDGSPYQKEETNQSGIASMFPPAPPTLVGAIRAACARALGWKGGNWCENIKICEQLGNGEKLGELRFRGPFIVRCKSPFNEADCKCEKTDLLFPAPANLMGKIDKPDDKPKNKKDKPPSVQSLTLLSPFSTSLNCDLGENIRLPSATNAEKGVKLLHEKGWWITAEGLEQVLKGETPNEEKHLVHQSQLWSKEPRIGIARSNDSRTTKEGALYSPSHIRLKKGVSIAMEVDGLSQECKKALPTQPYPVGGESRACWLRLGEHSLPFPKLPEWNDSEKTLRYTATVLTPADVSKPPTPGKENYTELPGRIVSACLPRPMSIGGWNSLERKPLPLKPYLAPGSVLFLEAEAEDRERVEELHNHTIGDRTDWGFGLVAIGLWNDSHK